MGDVPVKNKPPQIVVVGSINMDLVASMQHLPRPGETVTGHSFRTIPGGKGANQAVAAARLGAVVTMIARVGDDEFGSILKNNLAAEGIDTQYVFETPDCSSGVALIGVEESGANSITVIPAANGRLSVDDVTSCHSVIATADSLVVQLETPLETVSAAIQIAQKNNVFTILDPAPAPQSTLPASLIAADLISPNQTEAEALTGVVVNDWESAETAARRLQQAGARDVVLKMGEQGALMCSRNGSIKRVHARSAQVVDTTAAGDAFTAALAVALCEGHPLEEAVQFGSYAGTLACTKFGAQPAMPTRKELDQWVLSGSP